jgi:hypothetical protein
VLALVLLGLLVDDLVVAAETRVCAGHLASAEEGVHPAAVDVDAIAQLDVATAAIAAQHVPAAPLWHRRHHKHANETNRFKIEEKRTQTNRFKIEEKRTFVSSVNKSTMITSKQCIASSYEQTSKFLDQIIKEAQPSDLTRLADTRLGGSPMSLCSAFRVGIAVALPGRPDALRRAHATRCHP